MPVAIDTRICDNSPACGAARLCPYGALRYDSTIGGIAVDNSLCRDCFTCVRGCPSNAVKTAESMEELKKIEEEINNSNLTKDDLLEMQYGIRPGDPSELGENLFEATDSNWDEEVLDSEQPVIVDFWAEWCAPCRILAPVFKELAKEYKGKVKFAKLNTEKYPSLAYRYGVMNIPTMVVFKGGKEVDRIIGAAQKEMIAARIEAALGAA